MCVRVCVGFTYGGMCDVRECCDFAYMRVRGERGKSERKTHTHTHTAERMYKGELL